ncbi:putative acyl-activating enzyme 17, peroxisomal [Glycine max]|nr:putative acyl-activating enzyme 17, peroxisomal [Glycine max]
MLLGEVSGATLDPTITHMAYYKSLSSITVSDIESHGIAREDAATLHHGLAEIIETHGNGTPATWQHVSNSILNPELPFSFHQMLYYGCYKDYGSDPPAWIPDPESAALTNVWKLLERKGEEFLCSAYKDPITSFDDFQKFSVSNPEIYWKCVLDEMSISFSKPPECILRDSPSGESPLSHPSGQWLPGASINPAQNCLNVNGKRSLNDTVIIWRDEQLDDLPLQRMTLEELRDEDLIMRGDKSIPLYSRVVDAQSPMAVVIPTKGSEFSMKLRNGDVSWHDFLEKVNNLKGKEFIATEQPIETFTNILFSSGTTGDPKAIPWTNITPLKAAADAWCHMDVRKGDVVCWPTNLGWMMGPWLVYASLLNGASVALYIGSPLGSAFAKFVQDAKVTMLGVIPSIVRSWRSTNSTSGYDWSSIRCFGSTGEASNVDEYLWLMGRALYKPIIEYCGGTEIGGGFVCGSLLQAQSLAAFSTPAMCCSLFILDDEGLPIPQNVPGIGELALGPLMLGASNTLLNADHYGVYFKGMPLLNGKVLRRHGDVFERTARGYYHAHGRSDDTMNLGGIKVSSVEIERICNGVDSSILETAAIGVPPSGGGPELLTIAVVFKDSNSTKQDLHQLRMSFNSALQKKLNPLFRVSQVVTLPSLPRTASNKVMRRVLRQQLSETNQNSKI